MTIFQTASGTAAKETKRGHGMSNRRVYKQRKSKM